jgi:hypothetical protein
MFEPRLRLLTRYAVAIHPIAGVEQRTQELVVEPARRLSIDPILRSCTHPECPSLPLDRF